MFPAAGAAVPQEVGEPSGGETTWGGYVAARKMKCPGGGITFETGCPGRRFQSVRKVPRLKLMMKEKKKKKKNIFGGGSADGGFNWEKGYSGGGSRMGAGASTWKVRCFGGGFILGGRLRRRVRYRGARGESAPVKAYLRGEVPRRGKAVPRQGRSVGVSASTWEARCCGIETSRKTLMQVCGENILRFYLLFIICLICLLQSYI
jgi:hypothetical protein